MLANKKPATLYAGRGQVPGEDGLAVTRGRTSRTGNFLRHPVRRLAPGHQVHQIKLRRFDYGTNIFVFGPRGRRQAQVRVRRLSASRENSPRTYDPSVAKKEAR